jgi:hypothetical protein
MASNFKLSNVAAAACAGDGASVGLLPLLATGKIHLYDGSQATNPDTALGAQNDYCSSTVITLPSPAGTESNGVITVGTVVSGTCSFTGTPTWFRVYESNGTSSLCDGTVGVSGCDMNFAGGVSFISGGTIAISAGSFSIPAH